MHGFVPTSPSHDDGQRALKRMTDAIRHRGPDDSGFYNDPLAKLGPRRLSIIDVSGGHQPLANEDGSLWIVYNGEIFNHAELRRDLERAGMGSMPEPLSRHVLFGEITAARSRGMGFGALARSTGQLDLVGLFPSRA